MNIKVETLKQKIQKINWLSIIEYILLIVISGITILIFKPDYYRGNKFNITIELLLFPFIYNFVATIIILIVAFICGADVEEYLEKYRFKVVMLAFAAIMMITCRHSIIDYQYYVNIYTDSSSQNCFVGYVDIDSDVNYYGNDNYDYATGTGQREQQEHFYFIDKIYINNIPYVTEMCEHIPKIDLESHDRYYLTLSNGEQYYIEFIKKKKD